ncbi:MAG: LytTR family DNA-binding domain-containing protein [Ignavibacteriota bacterium]
MVPVCDIDWISADDYYARLHIGPKSYLVRESLQSLETRLDPAHFVRVHRAAILHSIACANSVPGKQSMRDGARVPISRRRRGVLEELLRRRS